MAWKSTPVHVDLDSSFAYFSSQAGDVVWLDSAQGHPELGQRSLLALSLEPWFSMEAPALWPPQLEERWSPVWSALDHRLATFVSANPGCPTGVVGYVSYEAAWLCDRAIGAPFTPAPIPLMSFALVRVGLVREGNETNLVVCAEDDDACDALLREWLLRLREVSEAPVTTLSGLMPARDEDAAVHRARIERTLEAIADGRVYQGCVTYPLHFERPSPMPELYRALRRKAPADYCAFLRMGDLEVASTSPERFFEVEERWVSARPMKGTRRRGGRPDAELVEELHQSAKDRSENVMIVDLLRNDLGRVCEVGSIAVSSLFEVEIYANVLQMTSTIRGRLEPEVGPFECFRALFPPGSMTGAPKIEACKLIGELEAGPRGVYSGSIGWLDGRGRASFSVVIRSLQAWGDEASWHVGGGIVWGSDPGDEWDETRTKAATILE